MTYSEALNSIEYWLRELNHVHYKDREDKIRVLKMMRREISMGINSGLIRKRDEYIPSGMAKLVEQRYPEMKIDVVESFAISPLKSENGITAIEEVIKKTPHKISYLDFCTWEKISKFFSTRRHPIPADIVKRLIPKNSRIKIRNNMLVLVGNRNELSGDLKSEPDEL